MTRALFIVDVQNDFTEGGALGVQGGAELAARISAWLATHRPAYALVVASRDWHDPDSTNDGHIALDGKPDWVQSWPPHCIADTPGAAYHPALDTAAIGVHVKKGQGVPAYSLYEGLAEDGRTVAEVLDAHAITHVDVVGIATDYCVRASVLDALGNGRRVRVLTDLIAGVAPASSAAALDEMARAGATLKAVGGTAPTPAR